MKAVISYTEISDFIEKEFRIRPRFAAIDENSFEVSYKPGIFMPAISVEFRVEAMCEDAVCLSYDCGTGASLIIAGVVAYLEEKIPSGIEVNTEEKRINIYPRSFEQIDRVLEYVTFSDITFEDTSVNIGLSIK